MDGEEEERAVRKGWEESIKEGGESGKRVGEEKMER